MTITPTLLASLSLGLLALAVLAVAGMLLASEFRRSRQGQLITRALQRSAEALAEPAFANMENAQPGGDGTARTDIALPLHWLNTRAGRALVADEDRRLIDQCGYSSLRAQWIFLVLRIGLAVLLPLLAYVYWSASNAGYNLSVFLGVAFVLGFMAPKWLLRRRAAARRELVSRELPLFVDLLRLLQGVGLSLDQSLHIMAGEFAHVLVVLGHELNLANRQYAQGRSREHSLQRLATLHGNEHLEAMVSLLVQVDRHGGAVQEPLRIFSIRLREHRRSEMKDRIGKITVKMTGIMVLTLLPALVIITAGPGFLAVIRSLGAIAR